MCTVSTNVLIMLSLVRFVRHARRGGPLVALEVVADKAPAGPQAGNTNMNNNNNNNNSNTNNHNTHTPKHKHHHHHHHNNTSNNINNDNDNDEVCAWVRPIFLPSLSLLRDFREIPDPNGLKTSDFRDSGILTQDFREIPYGHENSNPQIQYYSRAPLLAVRHEDAEVAGQGREDAEDHEGAVDGPRRCDS